jgi:hypothetical protein
MLRATVRAEIAQSAQRRAAAGLETGVLFLAVARGLFFSTVTRVVLGPTQRPIKLVRGPLSPGGNVAGA